VKKIMMAVAGLLAVSSVAAISQPANASGCLRGAVVGGVAGHFAGHGLLGAGIGCAWGHHQDVKRERYGDRYYGDRGYRNY
jgi:hypothetical protein